MIVLDTNVLSELMRSRPDQRVAAWVGAQPASSLFTSTLTEAEILLGVTLLPEGRRRSDLDTAAREMFAHDFAARVLPFDSDAASHYALIVAGRRAAGRPIGPFDAQIAAIAKSRVARLATRNIKDFAGCGIDLIDPWTA